MLIEVEDECGGLPDGTADKMFEPFEQPSNDRRGVGLGLTVARRAADLPAGRLLVHNLPGKGCWFVLSLPMIQTKRPVASSEVRRKG